MCPNIYISLTTISSRSKNILYTINSILNQTVLPFKIYITICNTPLREKKLDNAGHDNCYTRYK